MRRDLVRRAKELRINLSKLLEAALEAAIKDRARADWLAENREAISEYNAQVVQRGVFSGDWRRF